MNVAWAGECTRNEVAINIGDHKTTENILAKGAFTVATGRCGPCRWKPTTSDMATGRTVNKAEKSGLTFVPSEHVDAPVIEEFPLTMEAWCATCRIGAARSASSARS